MEKLIAKLFLGLLVVIVFVVDWIPVNGLVPRGIITIGSAFVLLVCWSSITLLK